MDFFEIYTFNLGASSTGQYKRRYEGAITSRVKFGKINSEKEGVASTVDGLDKSRDGVRNRLYYSIEHKETGLSLQRYYYVTIQAISVRSLQQLKHCATNAIII